MYLKKNLLNIEYGKAGKRRAVALIVLQFVDLIKLLDSK